MVETGQGGYLGGGVVGVAALRGGEAGAEHGFGHVDGDHKVLHRLPHGLLGAHRQVQAAPGAALEEADALLHVHRDGYEAGGGDRQTL